MDIKKTLVKLVLWMGSSFMILYLYCLYFLTQHNYNVILALGESESDMALIMFATLIGYLASYLKDMIVWREN